MAKYSLKRNHKTFTTFLTMNPIQPQNTLDILSSMNESQINLYHDENTFDDTSYKFLFPYQREHINTQMITQNHNQTTFFHLPDYSTNPQESIYQDHCSYGNTLNMLGSYTNNLFFKPFFIMEDFQGKFINEWMIIFIS